MEKICNLWIDYNTAACELQNVLGRTANIVGEFAEQLACKVYEGTLLNASKASADFVADDNVLYQVKSRRLDALCSTQLNVIRSWDFDYLIVVLFNSSGGILKGLEYPMLVAKEYAKANSHQNGWVITTSQAFLNDARAIDITDKLSCIINNAILMGEPEEEFIDSDRLLNSIGKECFIKYYEEFSNSTLDSDDLTELLMMNENCTHSSARTKVSCARRILNNYLAFDALNIIIDSKRLSQETISKAKKLLDHF